MHSKRGLWIFLLLLFMYGPISRYCEKIIVSKYSAAQIDISALLYADLDIHGHVVTTKFFHHRILQRNL